MYPENSVGRGRLRKKCHNCYTKIMGPKETNYTKYLLISPLWIAPVFINILNFRWVLITRELFKNTFEPVASSPLQRRIQGVTRGHAPPLFCYHFFFFGSHFEELQTLLFEVELFINYASLTYVYPNTIETCLTPS